MPRALESQHNGCASFHFERRCKKQLPAPIENENVHRAVHQFLPMHLVPRGLPRHAVLRIHDIEDLPVYILRMRGLGRRDRAHHEIRQRDPLLER